VIGLAVTGRPIRSLVAEDPSGGDGRDQTTGKPDPRHPMVSEAASAEPVAKPRDG